MKTLALFLFAFLPTFVWTQDLKPEINALSKLCNCNIEKRGLKKAIDKQMVFISGKEGSILPVPCNRKKYFFQVLGEIINATLINGDKEFQSNDKIVTYGPRWLYVKINDLENMKYSFEFHVWSGPYSIATESLGGEHF